MPLKLSQWDEVPGALFLAPAHLHLWRADIGELKDLIEGLAEFLSDGERRRASHYRFSEPQERFVIGRGVLRCVLSRYLDIPPKRLELGVGESGKPTLTRSDASWLTFNLAHTEGLLLILVSHGRNVGVDVEGIRLLGGKATMMSMLFRPEQWPKIRARPEESQTATVLRAWTLIEALGKADGEGLAGALRWAQLVTETDTGMPLPRQRCCSTHACYGAHTLQIEPEDVDVGPKYVGAIAVEIEPGDTDPDWDLRSYRVSRAVLRSMTTGAVQA